MPQFHPFPGVRYVAGDGCLDRLVAPPYDVIDEPQRRRLEALDEHNAVRLELPRDADGRDRYAVAAGLYEAWLADGVLARDDEASFYVYRMGFTDERGRPRQTSGVLGALALGDEGDVVPHEHTLPKDRADRLELLRSTQVNLSPIWALSPAAGLAALCEPAEPPVARATDDEGVHHRLWRLTRPALLEALSETVASAPVLLADGHHRFEVAKAYREERREANGNAPGAYDAVLTYVVELAEDQVYVRATHRLVSGLPEGFDLPGALEAHFELVPAGPPDASLPARMADAGAPALVAGARAWLLRSRPGTTAAAGHDLDASRLAVALAALPPHELRFHHDLDDVLAAAAAGRAQAAVLLRPVTVAQIAEVGRGGARMPPKTTFFHPKLRTGMVFREVPG